MRYWPHPRWSQSVQLCTWGTSAAFFSPFVIKQQKGIESAPSHTRTRTHRPSFRAATGLALQHRRLWQQIWAAGARSRSVYLTVCPLSLYTKAEQIRLCAHRQHRHHHPHPTIIPPLTWLPMKAQVTPEFSVKIVMRKECHIWHLLARCS